MRPSLVLFALLAALPARSEDEASMGRRALAIVAQGMGSKDAEIRAQAALAWGEIGNKAAIPVLRKALKDYSPHVRIEAAYALSRLGDPGGLGALETTITVASRLKLRRSPAQELRDLTRNKARAEAVARLGDIGGERAVAIMEKTLKDASPLVRDATRVALVKVGFDEFAEDFIAALADPDDGVRAAAARALAQIGRPIAVSQLRRAASDRSPAVRAEALRALGSSPEAGVFDVLARGAKDKERDVRAAAVAALARVPGRGTTDLLFSVAADTAAPTIAVKAMESLALRGEKIDLGLIRGALRVKDPELTAVSIGALAAAKDAGALELLREVMDEGVDPRARLRAAAVLVKRLQKSEGAR